ncbi:30S ribosomal protein S17 [Candidatus Shapirobacteria bacterium CG10_big_fil_rev_8_21_14_0_10_48_15]|uniref:Small ribosomal subunit protein uS17 n=1 Tax=Candidatus Shapirobacteria bacterium CG10_big_fil_rev_8_21_14_0_10_48_15 TaxID=1974484 RepID=A0A2M8L6U6_9BACT|nr:MAG: 30S ribosomal protein S17 [Candidatus Shapirobacteria bacterium CG10_big_fil_rev_8_21_14_0_10_48_15]
MKALKGKIVSDKMVQTATILVERRVVHPLYGKALRRRQRYHADNQIGAKQGDMVEFVATRPISKTKMWKIVNIIKK